MRARANVANAANQLEQSERSDQTQDAKEVVRKGISEKIGFDESQSFHLFVSVRFFLKRINESLRVKAPLTEVLV